MEEPKKGSMGDFFTRGTANNGIRVPLISPTGEVTDQWIIIASTLSDNFRKEQTRQKQAWLDMSLSGVEDVDSAEQLRENEYHLLATLVVDWSFEEECNLENKIKLFEEAPQIADMINRKAAEKEAFFKKPSGS